MDDLKAKAAPKYERLAKEASDQNAKLDVCIVLLDRLCTLKEEQRDGEDKRHEDWKDEKSIDKKRSDFAAKTSLAVLFCGFMALYLDLIKLGGNGSFIFDLMLKMLL